MRAGGVSASTTETNKKFPSNSRDNSKKRSTLVNPVLVTVGNPALPHQTPVYAWQIKDEEGK